MTPRRARADATRVGVVSCPKRRVGRGLVALAVVATVTLLPAGAASAHASLLSTRPAQSTHYPATAPPTSVALVFDEAVTATPTSIGVYDGAGKALAVRLATPGTHTRLAATLPKLPEGSYAVVWHVVSEDGHPEHGAFTFSVGRAGAVTTDINGLLDRQRSSPAMGVAFGLDRTLGFLAVLVLVGGLVFVRWRWPQALERPDSRRLLLGAAILALVATLLAVPLQAAYSTAGGASALTDWATLRGVFRARFGQAALARAALVVVLGWCVVGAGPSSKRWVRDGADLVSALAGIAVFATVAYAGHGFTGRWPTLALATDIAHLSAAALWLGGLVVLAAALRTRTWSTSLGNGAERFSQVALPAVALLILSGSVQGFRQIGSWSALWHTSYSRLLVLKVLVVVSIVIVASVGRDALRDRRRASGTSPAIDPDGDAATLVELRRGVWLEAGLAVVVVLITSLLVVSPPGREAVAAAARPTATTIRLRTRSESTAYDVALQPDLPGVNTIVVTPRRVHPSGFLPVAMAGTVTRGGSAEPVRLTFAALEDGRWVTTARLPTTGTWTVTLAGSTPTSDESARLSLTIR